MNGNGKGPQGRAAFEKAFCAGCDGCENQVEDQNNLPADDEVISSMLRDLSPRESRILQLRYGLTNGRLYTLEEIGKTLGITTERVRQAEAHALKRLRRPAHSLCIALYFRAYRSELAKVQKKSLDQSEPEPPGWQERLQYIVNEAVYTFSEIALDKWGVSIDLILEVLDSKCENKTAFRAVLAGVRDDIDHRLQYGRW